MVKLGSPKLYEPDPNAVLIPVQGVFIHQDYNVGILINDIAVILLAYPVNFSSYIQPVCLAEKMMEVKAGTPCWVTGWGRTEGIRKTVGQDAELGSLAAPGRRREPHIECGLGSRVK